jgi:diacylglycerol kinase
MAFSIKRLKHSFFHASRGIVEAWNTQQNFRIHIYIAMCIIGFGVVFSLSLFEWILVIASIILVVVMELLNTSIEYFADLIKEEYNLKVRMIKDISAAAVLISVILSIFVGLAVFIPKIWITILWI